jgi:hypothetical protein
VIRVFVHHKPPKIIRMFQNQSFSHLLRVRTGCHIIAPTHMLYSRFHPPHNPPSAHKLHCRNSGPAIQAAAALKAESIWPKMFMAELTA